MKWIKLWGGEIAFRADQFVSARIVRVTDQRWLVQVETIDGEGLKVNDHLSKEEAQKELASLVAVFEEA